MAQQLIDTTTDHGSYKGDPALTAFNKVNDNFSQAWAGGLPYVKSSINVGIMESIGFFLDGSFPDDGGPIYGVVMRFDENHLTQFYVVPGTKNIRARIKSGGNFIANVFFRHTGNTVVDSNGFIKQASPVFRLASDGESAADEEQDFVAAGSGASNSEARGVSASRIDVGVYRVTGARGLAVSGWTVEIPRDVNGVPMCFLDVFMEGSDIVVRVFRRVIQSGMVTPGDAMDVPDGRWIDLRLQMPE